MISKNRNASHQFLTIASAPHTLRTSSAVYNLIIIETDQASVNWCVEGGFPLISIRIRFVEIFELPACRITSNTFRCICQQTMLAIVPG